MGLPVPFSFHLFPTLSHLFFKYHLCKLPLFTLTPSSSTHHLNFYTRATTHMTKKKMKIPSIFKKNKETKWPSCKHPKTLSFRGSTGDDNMFKSLNSVFFDPADGVETPESWFIGSSETASFSTESEGFDGESIEMVVRGVRSERLFFQPGDTNSILEEAKPGGFPFKESVVLALESENPYVDFRRSMEEMVESHGLKDWECLEELLGWYLKVNGKKNHGFILGAFIDLLVEIAGASYSSSCDYSTTSASFSSAISSFSSSSPFCSFQEGINEIEEER